MRRTCRHFPASACQRIFADKVLEHMRLVTDLKKLAMLRSRTNQENCMLAERNRRSMRHPPTTEPN